jgi:hypothetical protein
MRGLAVVLFWTGLMQAGWAQEPGAGPLDIHLAAHAGFDRLIVTLPAGIAVPAAPQTTRLGDGLILALPGAGAVVVAHGVTSRHVLGVQGGQDQLRLALQPGSTARVRRQGRRLVVDVSGALAVARAAVPGTPAAAKPVTSAAPQAVPKPQPQGVAAAPPPQGVAAAPPPQGVAAAPPPQGVAAAPGVAAPPLLQGMAAAPPPQGVAAAPGVAAPPRPNAHAEAAPLEAGGTAEDAAAAPGPLEGAEALRAVRLPGPGDAILLPFDDRVGAAAFAIAGLGHAVFDESKAIDLAALRDDPVFGGARITVSPGSTHFSMALKPGAQLSLRRCKQGWTITVQRQPADRAPAPVRLRGDKLVIAMKQAADVVVVVDQASGTKLLVGTVQDHGQSIEVPHVSPEFRLLPSWEGVVAAIVSDRLSLDVTKEGFALGTASGPKLVTLMADSGQAALESVGSLTRHFDIPSLDLAVLRQRLDTALARAAHAPKQARFRPRLLAAQDMLGLGMYREAAAVLGIARHDDPSQEALPEAAALQAIAAWLGAPDDGTLPATSAIDNPALGASDEVALWRALMPRAGASASRAAVVAADWRLLAGYPSPLRRCLLPRAAALLIEGHETRAAEALLEAGGDLPMDGARAQLLAQQGRPDEALALLDRVAGGADRKAGAAALRDATELRLRNGLIKPDAAAQILRRNLYLWRAPAFELDRRLRIASLLAQAGDFRSALDSLREADGMFPQAHAQVRAAEDATIRTLVQGGLGAALAPLDLLALVADNADLLGQGEAAASLTPVLVEKLAALDLPERADRLVAKLIETTAAAAPKASLGARLAGLRLDQNDPAGALAALDQTMADGLPADVDARRLVARARALAELGEDGPALSLLAAQDSPEAWELAARLREKSHDWRGAELALQRLVQAGVPASGALTPAQQDLVLRLASAASQAGDGAALRALSAGAASRLSPGPRADLFAALSIQPVREVADLPRAAREAAAAQALPSAWAGYAAH